MPLKTPSFWYGQPSPIQALLTPLSFLYGAGQALHTATRGESYLSSLPVICVGNIVAGGSGKTPAAIAVMELVREAGLAANPCFLSRGYGGRNGGPVAVDPHIHTFRDVGDEPLLLSRHAPVIVSADRAAGARLAEQLKYDLIVMDDGFQNRGLHKALSFLVIDGESGFGNGRLLPAGPLREPVTEALQRTDAVIFIGDDGKNLLRTVLKDKEILSASLDVPEGWIRPASPCIAFCGIARPGKFRKTIESQGIELAGWHEFPDHHPYSENDLRALEQKARETGARLLTTEKDAVRLPPSFKSHVEILPVRLVFHGAQPFPSPSSTKNSGTKT